LDINEIEKRIELSLAQTKAATPRARIGEGFSSDLEVPAKYKLDRKGRSPKDILVKIKNKLKSLPVLGAMFQWFITLARIHVRIKQLYDLSEESNLIATRQGNQIWSILKRLDKDEFDIRHHRNLLQTEIAELKSKATKQGSVPSTSSAKLQKIAEDNNEVMSSQYADLYVAFEEHFRNNAADLNETYKAYKSKIEDLSAQMRNKPCLDIGCGKGFWLQYLKKLGFQHLYGVDSNYAMVKAATAQGFKVSQADAINYLAEQPSDAFAIVSAFHVVEHLPLEALIKLIDESFRIVAPGGFVLFETPNPENLVVGACNFYADLSHRNPIPPQTLDFIMLRRGFKRTSIIRKSFPELPVSSSDPAVSYILDWFAKGQDYAVIGYKS
jgi:SAM-dependent methyltransferase